MVTITVSAKDAVGATATGTITATQSAASTPVLTPISFTIPTAPALDTLIGTIAGTNNPTSYTIISGDPGKNFAVYAVSQHIRTSETIGPPPDNVYHLMVSGTNANGTGPAASVSITVGAIPVVVPASFSTQLPVTSGKVIGTVTAMGTPTSWAITAGNGGGFFAISNKGVLSITAAGAANIIATTYSLTITATNALGTSMPITIRSAMMVISGGGGGTTLWSSVDGSLAPGGSNTQISSQFQNAANTVNTYFPTMLNTYHPSSMADGRNYSLPVWQPPWNVAGVDYKVGPRFTPTLTLISTSPPAGCSIDPSPGGNPLAKTLSLDSSNTVLSGYNLTGWQTVVHGDNCTITDCFLDPANNSGGNQINIDYPVTNFTCQYCEFNGFDNGSGAAPSLIQFRGHGTFTVMYNVWYTYSNHPVECAQSSSISFSIVYKYNMSLQGTAGASDVIGQHLNFLQFGGGTCNSADVGFNTSYQTPQISGGEGFQFYMNVPGSILTSNSHNNTMIATGGATGSAMSYMMRPASSATDGAAPSSAQFYDQNYVDFTAAFGAFAANFGTIRTANQDMISGLTVGLANEEPA